MMDEITALVRTHDQDRYLASLFVPEAKRPHILALYGFNAEITRIAGSVSMPEMAEILSQWWLDTLDSIYADEPQAHPIADALAKAVKAGDVPKYALANLTKAHEFDFFSNPMPDATNLEAYLGETQGALIKMAAMILDEDAALECSEACGLAGVAYGISQILNKFPRAQALHQCFLPEDWLAQRGLKPAGIYAPENDAAMLVILAELRALAEKRLAELRKVAWTIKPSVAAAFLHVALAEPTLAKARKKGTAVLKSGCELSQLRKQWLLWKATKSELF